MKYFMVKELVNNHDKTSFINKVHRCASVLESHEAPKEKLQAWTHELRRWNPTKVSAGYEISSPTAATMLESTSFKAHVFTYEIIRLTALLTVYVLTLWIQRGCKYFPWWFAITEIEFFLQIVGILFGSLEKQHWVCFEISVLHLMLLHMLSHVAHSVFSHCSVPL